MWTRYLVGVSVGAVVTGLLFLMMNAMIASDMNPFTEPPPSISIELARVDEDQDVNVKKRKPDPPPPPDEPPPDMPTPDFQSSDISGGISLGNVSLDVKPVVGGVGGFSSDGEYLPIVKVAPVYPRRALTRGIEGYVLLEFTVSKTGAVMNPVVIEAKPEGIFDRAAQQAALKFKYKPKVVDGVAIDVPGVRNKITFELTEG